VIAAQAPFFPLKIKGGRIAGHISISPPFQFIFFCHSPGGQKKRSKSLGFVPPFSLPFFSFEPSPLRIPWPQRKWKKDRQRLVPFLFPPLCPFFFLDGVALLPGAIMLRHEKLTKLVLLFPPPFCHFPSLVASRYAQTLNHPMDCSALSSSLFPSFQVLPFLL